MARIRSIKPDFFLDDDLAQLSTLHRLAFIGLWTQADKQGRLEDKPARLKVTILPYDDCDMDTILNSLCEPKAFIIRYSANGHRYIQITNFGKHQRPHHTEAESEIPAFCGALTVTEPLPNGEMPDGREGKGRERKGNEKGMERKNAPALRANAEITLEDVALLKEQYPTLDVDAELENCQVYWLNDVIPKRKGPPNIRKFRNWLKNALKYQEERNVRTENSNGRREASPTRSPTGKGSLFEVDWGITSDEAALDSAVNS